MKKVFRLWKYIESFTKTRGINNTKEILQSYTWMYDCEGLTEEEILNLGYYVIQDWFVEEDNDSNGYYVAVDSDDEESEQ